MATYIISAIQLSPQPSFEGDLPEVPVSNMGRGLHCVEPDYKQLIPPTKLRRMNRILKMGLATSTQCINQSPLHPDAVIVGTGQGCTIDSEKFILSYEDTEELLSPIPFINSGHNTLAGQIAQNNQIKGYNITYLQEGAALESALTDAMLLLEEGKSACVLVGAIDEYSELSFKIFSCLDEYRNQDFNTFDLLKADAPGTIMGEGAGFFCLTNKPQAGAVELVACEARPKGLGGSEDWIKTLLETNGLSVELIDTLFVGRNGDERCDDAIYAPIESLFPNAKVVGYKHLCGEYTTSHSFALWMGVKAATGMRLPDYAVLRKGNDEVATILLYNVSRISECAIVLKMVKN